MGAACQSCCRLYVTQSGIGWGAMERMLCAAGQTHHDQHCCMHATRYNEKHTYTLLISECIFETYTCHTNDRVYGFEHIHTDVLIIELMLQTHAQELLMPGAYV